MKVVIFTPSRSVKGNVVLDYLFNNTYFNDVFSVVLVTDVYDSDFYKKYSSRYEIYIDDGVSSSFLEDVDFIVTLGWGKIVKNEIIKCANCAALNCHSSFLPDYKGASVYFHYWANCEVFSGATIHLLTEKVDSGNIIAQSKFKLKFFDSPSVILQRASELTGPLLLEALLKVKGGYKGEPNNGGRYFIKVRSKYQLLLYRLYNCFAKLIGYRRKLLPFKHL